MAVNKFHRYSYRPHCVVDNSDMKLWNKADVSSWPPKSGLINTHKFQPSRSSSALVQDSLEKSLGQWKKGLWRSRSFAFILICHILTQPETRVTTHGVGQSCSLHSDPWTKLWRAEPWMERELTRDHHFNTTHNSRWKSNIACRDRRNSAEIKSMSLWFYKIDREDGVENIPSIPPTPSPYWLGIQSQKN